MRTDAMERETVFSPCRKYRYTLWREFGGELIWDGINKSKEGYVQFIGLNPSTADETRDDPTIRKCRGFAKRWGYSAMCMTNLFAFRATQPKDMLKETYPIGPENDQWLRHIAENASVIVAAWGTKGPHLRRDAWVMKLIHTLRCLRQTKDGHPEHPLYVPYETLLKDFPASFPTEAVQQTTMKAIEYLHGSGPQLRGLAGEEIN